MTAAEQFTRPLYDDTGTLWAMVDAFDRLLQQREAYKAQRDEWARRGSLALLVVEDMPCTCYATRCHRHELEQALSGDA